MRTRGDNDGFHEEFEPDGHGIVLDYAELESELARRLRNLSWPKPPPGLKERCLRDILARMAEHEKPRPLHATRLDRARGTGERYTITRRAAQIYRAPLPAPPRPVRLAASL